MAVPWADAEEAPGGDTWQRPRGERKVTENYSGIGISRCHGLGRGREGGEQGTCQSPPFPPARAHPGLRREPDGLLTAYPDSRSDTWVEEQLPHGAGRSVGGRGCSAVLGTGRADPKEWPGKGKNTERQAGGPARKP